RGGGWWVGGEIWTGRTAALGQQRRSRSGLVGSPCPVFPKSGRKWCVQRTAALCRFCCKSLFAPVIKISFGCRRDFHVKMWGTSSPEDKLAGDLGNVIEATSIGGRRCHFFLSKKKTPGKFRLF